MYSMSLICLVVLFAVFVGIFLVGIRIVEDIIPDIKEVFSNTVEDEEYNN